MALDEALLEWMPRLDRPVFRSYGWEQKAASFGYFQKYAEVEQLTPLRPLVRRPTGGGVVPHDGDWTYTAVFPATHWWYGLKAAESYRRIHAWLQAAFKRLEVPTVLAPAAQKTGFGQCFTGYEQSDLLWRGRKIAGAAQRRTRDGLLIQGSIQPPEEGLRRASWEQALRAAGEQLEGARWQKLAPEPELWSRAERLRAEKYATELFLRKR